MQLIRGSLVRGEMDQITDGTLDDGVVGTHDAARTSRGVQAEGRATLGPLTRLTRLETPEVSAAGSGRARESERDVARWGWRRRPASAKMEVVRAWLGSVGLSAYADAFEREVCLRLQ